jgi:hypothetical protein
MASNQYLNLSIPKSAGDMSNFVSVLKNILQQLFLNSHYHILTQTSAPKASDGSKGDIYIITVSGTDYLYCKTSAGVWKRVALS